MDTIDVDCLGESLGSGVTCLASPAVSLGLAESVEADLGMAFINFSEQETDGSRLRGAARWGKVLYVDVLPVGMAIGAPAPGAKGRTGDGLLDTSYRLRCPLWILDWLVPELDLPVACWGRGLVIGRSVMCRREVGTVGDVDIIPELLIGSPRGWG